MQTCELSDGRLLVFDRTGPDHSYICKHVFENAYVFLKWYRAGNSLADLKPVKVRRYWAAYEVALLRYAVIGMQQALWYASPHSQETFEDYVNLGKKIKGHT